jgi:hypothetical protein
MTILDLPSPIVTGTVLLPQHRNSPAREPEAFSHPIESDYPAGMTGKRQLGLDGTRDSSGWKGHFWDMRIGKMTFTLKPYIGQL